MLRVYMKNSHEESVAGTWREQQSIGDEVSGVVGGHIVHGLK